MPESNKQRKGQRREDMHLYLDEKGLELHLSNGNKGYYNFSSPKQMEELEARIGHHGMKPLNFFLEVLGNVVGALVPSRQQHNPPGMGISKEARRRRRRAAQKAALLKREDEVDVKVKNDEENDTKIKDDRGIDRNIKKDEMTYVEMKKEGNIDVNVKKDQEHFHNAKRYYGPLDERNIQT